jgi:hypothetical protein
MMVPNLRQVGQVQFVIILGTNTYLVLDFEVRRLMEYSRVNHPPS